MVKTPEPTVAQAEAEAVATEQKAAELRAAVENGDDTVTPAQLAEAEQKGVFARLRIKAAQKREAAQSEADRHARAEQVAADARTLAEQDDPEDLAVKMRAAVDALAALYTAADSRHARIRDMVARVDVIRTEAERAGISDVRARYGVGRGVISDELSVAVGRTNPMTLRTVTPADAIAAAVGLGLPQDDRYAAPPVVEACKYLQHRPRQVFERVPAVRAVIEGTVS
ncbi:hypothetical protein [Streptomyces sp. NPDC054771]